MLVHCHGENQRKRGAPPGRGRRCGNWRHDTQFCHHHTWQADNPTEWPEEKVLRCPGKYLSDTAHHRAGDPCEQPGRTDRDGYCQWHEPLPEKNEKNEKRCPAVKCNGEQCGAPCESGYCHIHVAKAVAAMPGPRVITRGTRTAVFLASRGECYVCACVIRSDAFHCAHIVPDVEGGAATLENLRATCSTCNLRCGRKNLDVFKAERAPRAEKTRNAAILENVRDVVDIDAELEALAAVVEALKARKAVKLAEAARLVAELRF